MNTYVRRGIVAAIFTLIMIFIISNMIVKKASADSLNSTDSITEATISSDTNSTSQTNTTESFNATSAVNKPPVSIVNYSDEVTESSDTYDYSVKNDNTTYSTSDTTISENIVATTPAPTSNTEVIATPTPTTTPSNTSNTTSNVNITKKIFIGDSRTVGMQQTIGSVNGVVWSCKSAMGLNWMKSTGVPNIESQITSGTAVIILMGVNDLHNTNNYIQYINQKSSEWASKGAVTYYVSVNPINENTYKGFKNTKIETFNNTMQSGLKNVNYIDTYNYLITHECNYTSDGLHYKTSTSKKIYELINQNIQ